jgi:hypothetical protein
LDGAAELAPEPGHVDIHRLGRYVAGLPRRVQQLVARQDAAGVLQQNHQEVEFSAREVDRPALRGAAAGGLVQFDATKPQHRPRVLEAADATQVGADAGDHLRSRERLDHVVVGAELQAGHPIGLLASGREQDDRDRGLGADPADHLEAIQLGQHDVNHGQVHATPAEDRQRLLAVGGLEDLEAPLAR